MSEWTTDALAELIRERHECLAQLCTLCEKQRALVERDALVGIPPKTPEQTKLTLTAAQLSTVTWLVMVIMPGLAVAAGVAVHLRRRR